MSIFTSIWSFLSLVVIAWITHIIANHWERRRKLQETKMNIYLSWMPFFAECYARAAYPDSSPYDQREFLKKKMEILGSLQIVGPVEAMQAFAEFCNLAELGFTKDAAFDGKKFHYSFTELNGALCSEIHYQNPQEVPNTKRLFANNEAKQIGSNDKLNEEIIESNSKE